VKIKYYLYKPVDYKIKMTEVFRNYYRTCRPNIKIIRIKTYIWKAIIIDWVVP